MMAEISRVADVIVCSMVLEHWPEDQVEAFFARAGGLLAKNGIICILVPGSPRHWGIEDEIAGHRRRYTLESFRFLAPKMGLIINDLRGLTYPLSNWLLPLSNWLVRRGEGHKLNLSMQEQTMSSGVREVPFKTEFPRFTGWLVNEVTLLPFHLWQHWAARSQDCLVIYCELRRP
jgi:SAM-dependent methyltransferase